MTPSSPIPEYIAHMGTIRVSGKTSSKLAARCALHYFARGVPDIEFFYIGGNAGQQAMKAMGIFRYVVENNTEELYTVLFQPSRVSTVIKDAEGDAVKDAVYWRAYVLQRKTLEAMRKLTVEGVWAN